MAALALLAKRAFVFVVLLVAGIADRRRFGLSHRSLVAAFAFSRFVFSYERILRVLGVIERRHLPICFGVAALADLAEHTLVVVVFLVAGKAIGFEVLLMQVADVAPLALRHLMLAE